MKDHDAFIYYVKKYEYLIFEVSMCNSKEVTITTEQFTDDFEAARFCRIKHSENVNFFYGYQRNK